MKLSKLRRKLRNQARREYAAGNLDTVEFGKCMAVAGNDVALAELNETIERDVNPWNRADGLIGADWKTWLANVWDWFVANWPTILKIIITIAPLLILEPKHEDR